MMALSLAFGLFTGVAVAAYVLLELLLGFHTTGYAIGRYADMAQSLVPLALLFLGLRRAASRTGASSFGRSVALGMVISLIGALLATAFMFFYLKSINPQYVDVVIAFERDNLVATGMPDEIIVQKVNEMRLTYGVGARLIWGFFRQLGLGAVVGIGLSAYLSRARHSAVKGVR